ncbi:unnamed protein product [Cochlearia groenlandica]
MQFLQNSRRIAKFLKPIKTHEPDLRFVSSATQISSSFHCRNQASSTFSSVSLSQGVDRCSHFHSLSLSVLIHRSSFSSEAAKLAGDPTGCF